MQIESIKPANRTLSELNQSIKDFVGVDTVMTDLQWGGIDKADAGAWVGSPGFPEDSQRDNTLPAELNKPVVAHRDGKQRCSSIVL